MYRRFQNRRTVRAEFANIYKDTIFLMLNKIFDIDLSYFESHSSGDIENRFNSVSDIYEFISTALIST